MPTRARSFNMVHLVQKWKNFDLVYSEAWSWIQHNMETPTQQIQRKTEYKGSAYEARNHI